MICNLNIIKIIRIQNIVTNQAENQILSDYKIFIPKRIKCINKIEKKIYLFTLILLQQINLLFFKKMIIVIINPSINSIKVQYKISVHLNKKI